MRISTAERMPPIREALAGLRSFPDRILHHRRHLAIRNRITRLPRPRYMLVVCYANLCRSPYLEAVLRRSLRDIRIESAGIAGSGVPVPPIAREISARRGVDLSKFRSRPVVPAITRNVDLVLVMDLDQAQRINSYFGVPRNRIVVVGDLDPMPNQHRAVVDPIDKPAHVFEAVLDRLDRCAATLATLLRH